MFPFKPPMLLFVNLPRTTNVIMFMSPPPSPPSTLEALDPDSGRWLPVSARMLSERKYCGAAPLNGRLYVCGGLINTGRQRLASVEAFDPREGVFREVGARQLPGSFLLLASRQLLGSFMAACCC